MTDKQKANLCFRLSWGVEMLERIKRARAVCDGITDALDEVIESLLEEKEKLEDEKYKMKCPQCGREMYVGNLRDSAHIMAACECGCKLMRRLEETAAAEEKKAEAVSGETMILVEAIRCFGGTAQQLKAVEELSELTQAISKMLLCVAEDEEKIKENIAEEMADVEIMLDQLKLIYGNGDAVRRWRSAKLARLKTRIEQKRMGG